MRQTLVTLMIVSAFALGCVLGGQAPRAAAQDEDTSVEGVTWINNGTSIVFTNTSETDAFVIVGWQEDGEEAQILAPRSSGEVAVAVAGLENVTLYKMDAALACNPRQCVLCDETAAGGSSSHCPIPGWPPRGNEFMNVTGPPSWEK